MRNNVTIVGAGNVGATCAQVIAQRDYADVVLVDIIEGLPQGKALDIRQTSPIRYYDTNLIGTSSYEDTADSSVVVITSGVPRKPGMTRDDLVLTNMKIVQSVTEQVVKYSPNCIIVMVVQPAGCHGATGTQSEQVSANPRDWYVRHSRYCQIQDIRCHGTGLLS